MYYVVYVYVEYLAEQFIPKLTELLSLDVRFAGVALDNENTENAFFDLLQDQFEFLLHIPCSSHVIQLVVKNVLKHSSIQQPLQKMIEILNEISSAKELRLKVQNMAKTEHISVILTKPNATRWNSTLKAIRRFLVYKKVINYFKGNSRTHTHTHTQTQAHRKHTHKHTFISYTVCIVRRRISFTLLDNSGISRSNITTISKSYRPVSTR